MKICCVGDSLTHGDYGVFGKRGIANLSDKNYPFFLSEILEQPVCNLGCCGITSTGYLQRYRENRYDFSDADIILVMLGTNGGLWGEFKQHYIELVKALENDYGAEVILITPPHVTENPEFSNCGYAGGVATAVKCAKELAAVNKNKLIDLASYSEFNAENEKIMQPNDGLHYGELGYKHMATFIAKALVEFFPEKLEIKKNLI